MPPRTIRSRVKVRRYRTRPIRSKSKQKVIKKKSRTRRVSRSSSRTRLRYRNARLSFPATLKHSNYLIVGGGPVGLYLAIQLIEKGRHVTLVEKRTAYTRSQMVSMQNNLYNALPPALRVKLLVNNCYIYAPSKHAPVHCFRANEYHQHLTNSIMIKEFETFSLQYLQTSKNFTLFRGEGQLRPDIGAFVTTSSSSWPSSQSSSKFISNKIPYNVAFIATGDNIASASGVFADIQRTPLSPLTQYGGVFIYSLPALLGPGAIVETLPSKYEETMETTETIERMNTLEDIPLQNRLRIFRRQNDLLYLGVSLSPSEYTELQSMPANGLSPAWKEKLSLYLQSRGLAASQETPAFTAFSFVPSMRNTVGAIVPTVMGRRSHYLLGDAVLTANFFTGLGANLGFEQALYLVNSLDANQEATLASYKALVSDQAKKISQAASAVSINWERLDERCAKMSISDVLSALKQRNFNDYSQKGVFKQMRKDDLCALLPLAT